MHSCSKEQIEVIAADKFPKSKPAHICPSKLSKRELEDVYYSLLQDNLELKRKVNNQNEKIKLLSTKLQRMMNTTKVYLGKDKENTMNNKAMVTEQKQIIQDLKRANENLREQVKQLDMKLCSTKQFLKRSSTSQQTAQYKPSRASDTRVETRNHSTSVLNLQTVKDSKESLKSVSCQYLQELPMTNTTGVDTMDLPFKSCDENKWKTSMEEMKQKVASLERELAETHDEYLIRISNLEKEMMHLETENMRWSLERARREQSLDRQISENREIRQKLSEIRSRCDELTTSLNIEKSKVAELETHLKTDSKANHTLKTIEMQLYDDPDRAEFSENSILAKEQRDQVKVPDEPIIDSKLLINSIESVNITADDKRNVITGEEDNDERPVSEPQSVAENMTPQKLDDSGFVEGNKSFTDEKALINMNKQLMSKIADLQAQLDSIEISATKFDNRDYATKSDANKDIKMHPTSEKRHYESEQFTPMPNQRNSSQFSSEAEQGMLQSELSCDLNNCDCSYDSEPSSENTPYIDTQSIQENSLQKNARNASQANQLDHKQYGSIVDKNIKTALSMSSEKELYNSSLSNRIEAPSHHLPLLVDRNVAQSQNDNSFRDHSTTLSRTGPFINLKDAGGFPASEKMQQNIKLSSSLPDENNTPQTTSLTNHYIKQLPQSYKGDEDKSETTGLSLLPEKSSYDKQSASIQQGKQTDVKLATSRLCNSPSYNRKLATSEKMQKTIKPFFSSPVQNNAPETVCISDEYEGRSDTENLSPLAEKVPETKHFVLSREQNISSQGSSVVHQDIEQLPLCSNHNMDQSDKEKPLPVAEKVSYGNRQPVSSTKQLNASQFTSNSTEGSDRETSIATEKKMKYHRSPDQFTRPGIKNILPPCLHDERSVEENSEQISNGQTALSPDEPDAKQYAPSSYENKQKSSEITDTAKHISQPDSHTIPESSFAYDQNISPCLNPLDALNDAGYSTPSSGNEEYKKTMLISDREPVIEPTKTTIYKLNIVQETRVPSNKHPKSKRNKKTGTETSNKALSSSDQKQPPAKLDQNDTKQLAHFVNQNIETFTPVIKYEPQSTHQSTAAPHKCQSDYVNPPIKSNQPLIPLPNSDLSISAKSTGTYTDENNSKFKHPDQSQTPFTKATPQRSEVRAEAVEYKVYENIEGAAYQSPSEATKNNIKANTLDNKCEISDPIPTNYDPGKKHNESLGFATTKKNAKSDRRPNLQNFHGAPTYGDSPPPDHNFEEMDYLTKNLSGNLKQRSPRTSSTSIRCRIAKIDALLRKEDPGISEGPDIKADIISNVKNPEIAAPMGIQNQNVATANKERNFKDIAVHNQGAAKCPIMEDGACSEKCACQDRGGQETCVCASTNSNFSRQQRLRNTQANDVQGFSALSTQPKNNIEEDINVQRDNVTHIPASMSRRDTESFNKYERLNDVTGNFGFTPTFEEIMDNRSSLPKCEKDIKVRQISFFGDRNIPQGTYLVARSSKDLEMKVTNGEPIQTKNIPMTDDKSVNTKLETENIVEEIPIEKPMDPDRKTYTLEGSVEVEKLCRATSPVNTDQEISYMSDLPSEKTTTSTPRSRVVSRSPGEDKQTMTFTDSATMPSTSDHKKRAISTSLSEGEVLEPNVAGQESADRSNQQQPPPALYSSSTDKVQQTLEAISQELARCRRLLLQTRSQEVT